MSVFRAAAPRLSSLCSSSSRAPSFDDDVAAVRSRSNPRRRLFLCLISSRMVWHRLPTYLPSFPLRLVPLSQAQRAAYDATGFVKDLVFKTVPRVGKVRDRRKKEEKTSVRRLPRSFVVRPPPSLTLSLSLSSPPAPPPPPHRQLELKEYLTKVYGFDIATLRTSVLAGKKKRGKAGNAFARPDIKKVYVSLRPPSSQ